MKHWFKDQHFRSLLKNSSYLASSRVVAAICSLATVAFAGRGLGIILFGTLILITSYVKAASGISKFQSWQLVVRYGGQGLAAGDPEAFKTSTGFARPLTGMGPSERTCIRPSTSRRVAGASRMVPGVASCSIRAARCVVSPTAV